MIGRALFMVLLMLLSPVPAAFAAASGLPGGGAPSPQGESLLGEVVNLVLITVGLRDPPFEPLGGEYTRALKELSQLKRGFKGELSLFRVLTEDISMELEEGDTEDALRLVNLYLTVLNQSKSELAMADERFRNSSTSVTKKLNKVKKRIPRQKLEKHSQVVSTVAKENWALASSFENLSLTITQLRADIKLNETSDAYLKLNQTKLLLEDIQQLLDKADEGPKGKVKMPEQLPTRPSKGKKIKPRTTFPKEKPHPATHKAQSQNKNNPRWKSIFSLIGSVFAEETENQTYSIPPEIANLSVQLDHNPAKIYAYVRDEIEYTPYYGYMKGSLWTMWEKAGNDFDQAALLSDLLRAAGYQTRFVIGTVEVEPEYMQMVLGVNSTEEALQLLWENYVPAELSNRKILVEHIWVEVKLPYGMYSDECYRGYIANKQACGGAPEQWIPLDPTFVPYKPKEPYPTAAIDYNLTGVFLETLQNATFGEDFFTGMNFSSLDFAVGELMNLTDEWYAENVGAKLENMTEEEVEALYAERPPDVKPDIIPGTLPYSPLVFETYSDIPDDFLHMINIKVMEGSTEILSFNIPSTETVGRQLTLDYVPANEDVAELVNAQASLTDLPAYLLDFRPILMLDSIIIAVGNASTFGSRQELQITITTPNMREVVTSPLQVGNYYAIAFDLGDMPAENVERIVNSTFESLFVDGDMLLDRSYGGYLALNALTYFSMSDLNYQMLAESMGVRWWRASPAVAVFGYTYNTAYIGSIPADISESFSHIDVVRNILSVQGDKDKKRTFTQLAGGISSSWESQLFSLLGNTTGISTVDILSVAAERGIAIQYLTSSNIAKLDQLSIPTTAKEAIRNAVNQGYDVYVPVRTLTIGNWTGVGWLVVDPATGANAWMISDDLGNVIHGGTGHISETGFQYSPFEKASEITVNGEKASSIVIARPWSQLTSEEREKYTEIGIDSGIYKLVEKFGNVAPYASIGTDVGDLGIRAIKTEATPTSSALKHEAKVAWGYKGYYTKLANRLGNTAAGKIYRAMASDAGLEGSIKYKSAKLLEISKELIEKEVKVGGKVIGTKGGFISGGLSFIGGLAVGAETINNMKKEAENGNMNNVAVEMKAGYAKLAVTGIVGVGAIAAGPGIAVGAVAIGITYVAFKVIDHYKERYKT